MRLYIIGNGFDLHHGILSSYRDYRKYLLLKHSDLVREYEETEYLQSVDYDDELKWSAANFA